MEKEMTETFEPEKCSGGGLYIPGNDRVVYLPPERKSCLGLSQYDGGFKMPKERTTSIAASTEDKDKPESSLDDESGRSGLASMHRHTNRRYREMTSETPHAVASPWNHVSPSPLPMRASGFSAKSSGSRHNERMKWQIKSDLGEEHKYEMTESMRLEMEYNADRA